jgi:3-methylfumaryl-CoA hydratase
MMSLNVAKTESNEFTDVLGRIETCTALISADKVQQLASTLGVDVSGNAGEPLPPGWHWIFFNPFVARHLIGEDGHPKRGGFLPDVGLPRRMWAGGRLKYHSPLTIGSAAEKISEITNVTSKTGRAGRLVFVTVTHKISQDGKLCVEEEQDIVYREAPQPGAPTPAPPVAPESSTWSEMISPDPVLLFRYSTLTSNGHRIHYDSVYAREIEGYPDLVVHGPLISTLLQGLACRAEPGKQITSFDFRAVSPIFVSQSFNIEAKIDQETQVLHLWARKATGELAMTAEASFA